MMDTNQILQKYDVWNETKKALSQSQRNFLFKEGEIWWCILGLNVGEETYGKGKEFTRPVVIIKKLSKTSCIVMPTTTQVRTSDWYYHIHVRGFSRWVMMHQIRFISSKRLIDRESVLYQKDLEELKKSAATLLGLFSCSPVAVPDQWEIPNDALSYHDELETAIEEYNNLAVNLEDYV